MLSSVKLISITQPIDPLLTPEGLIAYCARVSSPNQENPKYANLLKYCMRNKHWSVFEMADMTLEITTSRAISAQILRHKSFNFQEFSTRYSEINEFIEYPARRQDLKNRQNSIDDLPKATRLYFKLLQKLIYNLSYIAYKSLLKLNVAKECARMILPMSTKTKIYMKGSIRSWITYCLVRCHKSTQEEHREIAEQCKRILIKEFPLLNGLM